MFSLKSTTTAITSNDVGTTKRTAILNPPSRISNLSNFSDLQKNLSKLTPHVNQNGKKGHQNDLKLWLQWFMKLKGSFLF